jgi:hypothetical protein
MRTPIGLGLSAIVFWAGIAGCAAVEPHPYHDEREIMQGPGLFSGEEGQFTIYRLPEKEAQVKPEQSDDP